MRTQAERKVSLHSMYDSESISEWRERQCERRGGRNCEANCGARETIPIREKHERHSRERGLEDRHERDGSIYTCQKTKVRNWKSWKKKLAEQRLKKQLMQPKEIKYSSWLNVCWLGWQNWWSTYTRSHISYTKKRLNTYLLKTTSEYNRRYTVCQVSNRESYRVSMLKIP